MPLDWDPAKAAANLAKHGVAFTALEGFDWQTAQVIADTRLDYGEVRLTALGLIGDRPHTLVFTIERRAVRVISLRRSSQKEARRYAESQDSDR